MTFAQAEMIVRNPDAYDEKTVRTAAVFILGSLDAPWSLLDLAQSLI